MIFTCAQQHLAFAQVLDGLRHLAQTLLRQVRRVGQDDVEAARLYVHLEGHGLVVVVEDKVVAVGGEAPVELQHGGGDAVRAVHHALLQLLVHTGCANTRYPKKCEKSVFS